MVLQATKCVVICFSSNRKHKVSLHVALYIVKTQMVSVGFV